LLICVGFGTVVVVVWAVAGRFGMLSPILLVVAGVALSFIRGVPEIRLQREVVLIGTLPPLLYVAAIETSVPAFRFNLRPILLLAVGLVIFTAACVGIAVPALLPQVPLAACFALGAVVAPPDAVAATSVARRIGLPRRTVAILEGESLVNDATALVIFRVAVAGAIGQTLSVLDVAENTLIASVGGILLGGLGGRLLAQIHRPITHPLLDHAGAPLAPLVGYAPAPAGHAAGARAPGGGARVPSR